MHVFRRATEDLVEQNNSNADHAADSNQTQIDAARDPALAERQNQPRLRRRQWMWTKFSARCADKTVGLIDQIEHWRNHKRARDNTNDQSNLLLPRCRIDELSGLEILEVVVRNRRHIEDHSR